MNAPFTGPVAREIRARIEAALQPTALDLIDDSEKHRGHGGYRGEDGESHFTIRVESPAFAGLNRVQRQRLVYRALGDLMHERIHALAMETKAPGE